MVAGESEKPTKDTTADDQYEEVSVTEGWGNFIQANAGLLVLYGFCEASAALDLRPPASLPACLPAARAAPRRAVATPPWVR